MDGLNLIDWVLIGLLGLAFVYGWWSGFIKIVGNLVGLVVGIIVAGWYYQAFAAWGVNYLPEWAKGFQGVLEVLAFLVILIVFNKVTGMIFEAVNHAFQLIPVIGSLNRLSGAILSVLEAALVLAVLLFVLGRYPSLVPDSYQTQIESSTVANKVEGFGKLLEPLYPQVLAKLPSIFNNLSLPGASSD